MIFVADYIFNFPDVKKGTIDELYYILQVIIITETQKYTKGDKEFEDYFFKQHSQLESQFEKIDESERSSFRQAYLKEAKTFYKVALKQMTKRLPAYDSLLMKADCITLKGAIDIDTFKEIAAKFPNIIQSKDLIVIFNEFERLALRKAELCDEINQNLDNPIAVWKKQAKQFPLVYKLVRALDLLPYSTAAVGRNFSWMTDTKTPKRNRLGFARL